MSDTNTDAKFLVILRIVVPMLKEENVRENIVVIGPCFTIVNRINYVGLAQPERDAQPASWVAALGNAGIVNQDRVLVVAVEVKSVPKQ